MDKKIGGQFRERPVFEIKKLMGPPEEHSAPPVPPANPRNAATMSYNPASANPERSAPAQQRSAPSRRRKNRFPWALVLFGIALLLLASAYLAWLAMAGVEGINQGGFLLDIFNLLSTVCGARTLLHIASSLRQWPYGWWLAFFTENAVDTERARLFAWGMTALIILIVLVVAFIVVIALFCSLYRRVSGFFQNGADSVARAVSNLVKRITSVINKWKTNRDKKIYNTDRMDSGLVPASQKQAMKNLQSVIKSNKAPCANSYLRVQDLTESRPYVADRIERWDENGRISLDWESDERSYEITFQLRDGKALLYYEDPDSGQERGGEFDRNSPIIIYRDGRDGRPIARYVITWFGGE